MEPWYSNSHFCCVGLQIILINCQCLILAGWHRLKLSPQGMLGIYRPFYWERRAHDSKCVNGSASKLLFFPFFPGGVGTEDPGVEKSGLYLRICRGIKICQIAVLETILYNVFNTELWIMILEKVLPGRKWRSWRLKAIISNISSLINVFVLLFRCVQERRLSPALNPKAKNSTKADPVTACESTTWGNVDIHKRPGDIGRQARGGGGGKWGYPEDRPFPGILITSFTHPLRVFLCKLSEKVTLQRGISILF